MKSYLCCLSLALLNLAPYAEAQPRSHEHESVSVSGEVETRSAFEAGLVVVLSGDGDVDRRADVHSGGEFEFANVPTGHYELKVTTLHGQVIHHEYVSLSSMMNRISVRLPEEQVERPASGTVSAAKLRHKVPSKARKEYEKGVEAARKNDSASAIGHLAKATELDPGYAEAHNNLGVQHLKAKAYETALEYFQKAVELDPGAREPLVNLAGTLVTLERSVEAEAAARRAVRLDGSHASARYFLGLALLQQQKNTSEALDHLQRASETFPRARLAIAEAAQSQGDVERAKKELRAYLNSGKLKDRQSVETWLAELK
jgi:tetratricopeptide (TPR) repeat protein